MKEINKSLDALKTPWLENTVRFTYFTMSNKVDEGVYYGYVSNVYEIGTAIKGNVC